MKKERLPRKELERQVIEYWLNEGTIISGLQTKENSYELPDWDEYNWREDGLLQPWAKEILEDDTQLIEEQEYDPETIEFIDPKAPREATDEEKAEVINYWMEAQNPPEEDREDWLHDFKLDMESSHTVVYDWYEELGYAGKLMLVIEDALLAPSIYESLDRKIKMFTWEDGKLKKITHGMEKLNQDSNNGTRTE